jgi:uncharacterized membrane protein
MTACGFIVAIIGMLRIVGEAIAATVGAFAKSLDTIPFMPRPFTFWEAAETEIQWHVV